MDGLTPTNIVTLPSTTDPNWRPQAFADVNGDGKPDMVFRYQIAGTLIGIFLDNLAATGAVVMSATTDVNWALIAPR